MRDRSEWVRGESGNHHVGRKVYKNLTKYTRACATCGEPFSIFVTKKIADGEADSNSFGLRNCEAHRRGGGGGQSATDIAEKEKLRMENNVMKEELSTLYARVADLEARLSRYELQPAMQRASTYAPPIPGMPWLTDDDVSPK